MIWLGTSGYVYKHWARIFYEGVPQRRWLQHYAAVFRTVELNNTFYRLPTPQMVDGWRKNSPPGFLFACKGSRFLTHMKRLLEHGEGLTRFFDLVNRLGRKLGPILWQLPAQMNKADEGRLESFLQALPPNRRHVFEFRSEAWYTQAICRVLDRHGVAFCEHDLVAKRPPRLTGPFRYLRFHGASSKYSGRYGKSALAPFAGDLSRWSAQGGEIYAYFNNDLHGHALMDALELSELLGDPLPVHLHPAAD
jgi:uncharacterized protein YecE (DUF72 family)